MVLRRRSHVLCVSPRRKIRFLICRLHLLFCQFRQTAAGELTLGLHRHPWNLLWSRKSRQGCRNIDLPPFSEVTSSVVAARRVGA